MFNNNLGEAISVDNYKTEEFVVPPKRIIATTYDLIGASLLWTLEEFVFGMPLSVFLHAVQEGYYVFHLTFCMDDAKQNRKTMDAIRVGLCLLQATLVMVLCISVEVCVCHKHGRIVVHLMHSMGLVKACFSLSRVLIMRKPKRQLKRACAKHIEQLEWVDAPPPDRYWSSNEFLDSLVELLTPWHEVGDRAKDAVEFVRKFVYFFAGPKGLKLHHYCPGRWCCKDRADGVRNGKRIMFNAMFVFSIHVFNIQRWTKQKPSLQWFGRAMLVPILPHALQVNPCV